MSGGDPKLAFNQGWQGHPEPLSSALAIGKGFGIPAQRPELALEITAIDREPLRTWQGAPMRGACGRPGEVLSLNLPPTLPARIPMNRPWSAANSSANWPLT